MHIDSAKQEVVYSYTVYSPQDALKKFYQIFGMRDFPQDQIELQLAALRNPLLYLEALQSIIWAVPTNKELRPLPWVPSTLKGLHAVVSEIQKAASVSLQEFPIVIFDQSEKAIFEKNKAYLQELEQQWGTVLIHFSKEEILSLASSLHLVELIDTSKRGSFGFGGARNAVFFLAPLFHYAFQKGINTPKALLSLDLETLQQWFALSTLEVGSDSHKIFIGMGDDDMMMPTSYFFSAPLLAKKHETENFLLKVPFIGYETTRYSPEVRSLKEVLKNPFLAHQTPWTETARLHPIAGSISSPRFTLSLGLGGEESFDIPKIEIIDQLTEPLVHAGGSKLLPQHTSSLQGLSQRLSVFLPHILQFSLLIPLTDSTPDGKAKTLPWKDPSPNAAFIPFWKSLSEVSKLKHELQLRFFKQLQELMGYSPKKQVVTPYSLVPTLEFLRDQPIDEIIEEFCKEQTHSSQELLELSSLKKLYKELAEDAKLALIFLNLLQHKIKRCSSDVDALIVNDFPIPLEETRVQVEALAGNILTLPLTGSLYLIIKCLGEGDFCKLMGNLLKRIQKESSAHPNGSLLEREVRERDQA